MEELRDLLQKQADIIKKGIDSLEDADFNQFDEQEISKGIAKQPKYGTGKKVVQVQVNRNGKTFTERRTVGVKEKPKAQQKQVTKQPQPKSHHEHASNTDTEKLHKYVQNKKNPEDLRKIAAGEVKNREGHEKNLKSLLTITKNKAAKWHAKQVEFYTKGGTEPHSPERKGVANFFKKKGVGIIKGLKEEGKEYKHAANALRKVFSGKHKEVDHHESHAVKTMGKHLAMVLGTMALSGHLGHGAEHAHETSAITGAIVGGLSMAKGIALHYLEHAGIMRLGHAVLFAKAEEGEELNIEDKDYASMSDDEIMLEFLKRMADHAEHGNITKDEWLKMGQTHSKEIREALDGNEKQPEPKADEIYEGKRKKEPKADIDTKGAKFVKPKEKPDDIKKAFEFLIKGTSSTTLKKKSKYGEGKRKQAITVNSKGKQYTRTQTVGSASRSIKKNLTPKKVLSPYEEAVMKMKSLIAYDDVYNMDAEAQIKSVSREFDHYYNDDSNPIHDWIQQTTSLNLTKHAEYMKAVFAYTSNIFFGPLNQVLREGDASQRELVEPMRKTLSDALKLFPNYSGAANRIIHIPEKQCAEFFKKYEAGKTVKENSFISCLPDYAGDIRSIAKHQQKEVRYVQFAIMTKTAKDISSASINSAFYGPENTPELLIDAGKEFKVLKVESPKVINKRTNEIKPMLIHGKPFYRIHLEEL